jgi:glucose-6-phosphate dehydrogenase assembly protein OpcA
MVICTTQPQASVHQASRCASSSDQFSRCDRRRPQIPRGVTAGVSAGQARSDADLDAAADAVAGALLYVALARQNPAPERIAGLVDMVMDGISPRVSFTTTASRRS